MSADRLYGIRDAEELHDSIVDAYELHVEPSYEPEDGPCVIEEWTVHPPRYHLPSAPEIAAWLVDEAELNGDLTDEAGETLRRQLRHPEILTAADALLEALAARMTYRMADEMVAEHDVTFDADGKPMVDGKPLYVPTTDIQEPA